jgi:hypothetical protein
MDRRSADEALTRLGAVHDRIATAMFTIDSHSGLAFLRGGGLTGRTAQRWQTLAPEVDQLWAGFTAFGELLERGRAIRAKRRLDDDDWDALHLLVMEPVVALDAAGLPVEPTASTVASRLRLAELGDRLTQRSAALTDHLSEVDSAWSAVAARIAPLSEAFDAASALAAELGLPGLLEPIGGRLSRARSEQLSDPLAAAPGGQLRPAAHAELQELTTELDAVRRRLAEVAALRDGYPGRVAALRGVVDEVAGAEQGVREAYARAEQKIAEPALPAPPAAAAILRARLPDPTQKVHSGGWERVANELAGLERSARQALARAAELRAAADGLLGRRDELRGRLEAYRAKAGRLGFAEDEVLTERHQRAHSLLYTAPCDLRQATQAVHAYQQALANLIAAESGGVPHGGQA